MYIWILLATIMVAFSFYNISPRADKENYINEAKTSIIVNRFKMEHSAFTGTMRCEIVNNTSNGNWRDLCTTEDGCPIQSDVDFGYTAFAQNLPIGYSIDESVLKVNHFVYPLNKKIDETDQAVVIGSTAGRYYGVSFAKIPERWVRKDEIAPIPMLNNFLSKNSDFGTIYGWADCEDDTCKLVGIGTKRKEGVIIPNSVIWANTTFNEECKLSGVPCFFAYTELRRSDIGRYCEEIRDEYENNL